MGTVIQGGIKKIREAQRIPERAYMWKLDKINVVKGGPNATNPGASNFQAVFVIDGGFDPTTMEEVDLEDEQLLGRRASNYYLGCPETDNWGNLVTVLNAAKLEDIPETEDDEEGCPCVENLAGVRMPGHSVCDENGYQGRVENNVKPIIDPAYIEQMSIGGDSEDEDEDEIDPTPARRKKTAKKKARSRSR